jgi:hypothetical protein
MPNTTQTPGRIAPEQALTVAQAEAAKVYRDLTPYRIRLSLEADGWHVDYELKDSAVKGGGPHFVIDATSGAVLRKRYEQ